MKIVAISDTHTRHDFIQIPECDVLVHAGDFSFNGKFFEVRDFLAWLQKQPAKHKVVIAGNHEETFDGSKLGGKFNPHCRNMLAECGDETIHYLENSSVTIDGIKFYGTPWTPFFYDWAFNGLEGSDAPFRFGTYPNLSDVYGEIPEDTNVLVCHGPPYGMVDRAYRGDDRCGSMEMRKILESNKLMQLQLYLCGHIHEARGHEIGFGNVHVCNVSSLGRDYKTAKPAVVIDLDEDGFVDSIQGYEDDQ